MTQHLRVWSVWVLLCLRSFAFMASCFHCHSCPYQFVVSPGWSTPVTSFSIVSGLQTGEPASIQLFFSCWYSGHTESSSVSAVRAKEECRKWGNGEQRSGVSPLHLMLCGPKNRQHPSFFSNPSASLFSHPASFLVLPSSPSPSSSSLFLCKHPLWCPLITLLQCNPRQFWPYKRSRLDEGLTLGAVYFNTTVFSRLLRQN